MPYACKFCKGKYCAAHRLPENHDCQGLGAYRERMRAEGRIVAPDPLGEPMRPVVTRTARAHASMDRFWRLVDAKMTFVFMGVIVGIFLLEWIILSAAPGLFDDIFTLESDWLTQPWTIILSVFSHDPFVLNHILFNTLALLFFGQTVERLIGTRRFTYLFLGAGAVAGIAQVILTKILFNVDTGVVGASGALQAIMGTLTVLAPRLTILVFFVVPAPLWALTALYVVFDLVGAISPGSQVAHFAHLAGLAVGLWFGYHLRQKGMRVHTGPPPIRRSF